MKVPDVAWPAAVGGARLLMPYTGPVLINSWEEIMLRWKTTSIAALLMVACLTRARADERALDLNDNAALKYWRAFALMPHLSDEEQNKYREGASTMPLDDKVKELVSKCDPAFHELHHAAKVTHCAWSMNIVDGIYARMPECPAARTLATLGALHIRLRFEEKRNAEAVDAALDLIKLGRDISTGGTIIGVLVGIAVEAVATEAVAANLPRLGAAALTDFSSRLNKLPAMGTVAAAMSFGEERGFLIWFIGEVEKCKDKDALLKLLESILRTESSNDVAQEAKAFLAACGGNKEGVLKQTEAARPAYKRWAKNLSLPLDQFQKFWEREEKEVLPTNIVMKTMAPALQHCRLSEARYEARRKLLNAAIAVQLEGQQALKSHGDPFGNGPFEYSAFDGGFELKSKLKLPKGKDNAEVPMSLVIGKRNKS
jgi:hypothetical protein